MIEIIVGIAIVATFLVYALILWVMWKSARAQNLLNLVVYLSQESLRTDRENVINLNRTNKPWPWLADEIKATERVCASYNLAGLLAKDHAIPTDTFVSAYTDSLKKCYAASEKLLSEYRRERGQEYWCNFDWLVKRIKS